MLGSRKNSNNDKITTGRRQKTNFGFFQGFNDWFTNGTEWLVGFHIRFLHPLQNKPTFSNKLAEVTLSLLLTTQETFVNIVDQDQTAQNVRPNLWSTLFTFLIITQLFLYLAMELYFYVGGGEMLVNNILSFSDNLRNSVKDKSIHFESHFVNPWTLYHIIPTFNDPEKEAIWKHCGKRRKCW